MSELPTPRELLIALHADWRLSRRDLGRLVAAIVGSGRESTTAGVVEALASLAAAGLARGESGAPPFVRVIRPDKS